MWSVAAARFRSRERPKLEDLAASVRANRRSHEGGKVDAVEIERAERFGQDRDPFARCELGVDEDDGMAA